MLPVEVVVLFVVVIVVDLRATPEPKRDCGHANDEDNQRENGTKVDSHDRTYAGQPENSKYIYNFKIDNEKLRYPIKISMLEIRM